MLQQSASSCTKLSKHLYWNVPNFLENAFQTAKTKTNISSKLEFLSDLVIASRLLNQPDFKLLIVFYIQFILGACLVDYLL